MADPIPVTDPALLAQLNGPQTVNDPAVLAQLNAGQPPRGVFDMLTGQTGPRYQLWPERFVRGVVGSAYSGATLPGDVMTGKTAADDPSAIGRSMELAAMATPVKPRMGTSVAGPSAKPPTSKELLETGGSQIERARTSGVDIAPSGLNNWADVAKATLDKAGSSAENAPAVHAILDRALAPAPGGATVTYDNLITLRRTLQEQARNFNNPSEQLAASRALKSLDEFMSNPPAGSVLAGDAQAAGALYAEGRGNYAAGKRSETVAEAREDALYSAAAANSGKNIGNRERQTFNSIRKSDPEISGFNPAERSQIEQNIIMGTKPTNFFRDWANRLGGGGGAGQSLTAGLGAVAGSPFGVEGSVSGAALGAATLPAIGIGARALANKLTDKQITKLDEMVRSRSPMAEQTAMGPGAQTNAQQLRDTLFFKLLLENLAQERR